MQEEGGVPERKSNDGGSGGQMIICKLAQKRFKDQNEVKSISDKVSVRAFLFQEIVFIQS